MLDQLVYRAEQAFLGACLNDPKCFVAGGVFRREHWTDSKHAMIYTAIGRSVQNHHGACGPIEVADELGDFRDKYSPYLVELMENCCAPSSATEYAGIIREHSKLRLASGRIARVIEETTQGGTAAEMLAKIQTAVSETNNILAQTDGYVCFREALDLAMLERARLRDRSGVPTTIPRLDFITGGFSGPTLTVIGARTGVGKSLVGGQIAINAAVRHQRPVGIISLEMGAGEIMSRMLTYLYGEGPIPEGGDDAPLYIDHTSRELDAILYRVREWKIQHSIELCIIDYMQIIHAPGYRQRYEEVGAISRALKALAMELNMPLVVLAQLSREHIKQGRTPGLSDLRECGSIEQDADLVLLLYASKNQDGMVKLDIAKHRNGPAGEVIDLQFERTRMCLREVLS